MGFDELFGDARINPADENHVRIGHRFHGVNNIIMLFILSFKPVHGFFDLVEIFDRINHVPQGQRFTIIQIFEQPVNMGDFGHVEQAVAR